jgi:hypothetical protein
MQTGNKCSDSALQCRLFFNQNDFLPIFYTQMHDQKKKWRENDTVTCLKRQEYNLLI